MIGYVSYHCVERLPIGVKVPVRLWVAYTRTFYQGVQAKVSFERKDVEFVDPNRICCGYKWKRLPKTELKIENTPKNHDYNKRIEVYQYDTQGNFIKKYLSVRQVTRDFLNKPNVSGSHFVKSILNSDKIWHNHVWCTQDHKIDFSKLYAYALLNSDGVTIGKFHTMAEIARYLKVDPSTVKYHIEKDTVYNDVKIIKY